MRRSFVLGVLVVLAVGATACRVPSPLTYPLLFTQPVDALDEVEQLLGGPPPPAPTPVDVARTLAVKLARQSEGARCSPSPR